MIRYALACGACGHRFDGWFASGESFDVQAAQGQVVCPTCAGSRVTKAPMAPAIAGKAARADRQARMLSLLRAMTAEVKARAEPVGERFPEEARRIHYGESPERPIWGRATGEEARALRDEGIEVAQLPELADDA